MLLDNSLKALKVKTMEGLLVHNARDLREKTAIYFKLVERD